MSQRAHGYGSFAYKVIDPVIKGILENRERLNNTLQIGMPFVKATATVDIPEFLKPGNVGFTLGIHGHPADISYENIFSDASNTNNSPLVGYTYTSDGTFERVYAKAPDSDVINMLALFDQGANRHTEPDLTYNRVPPPGITRFSIGRNKNGLLAIGEFTFSVPSLIQLEVLHRTFLIPGVGMVLEWGQQFALDGNEDFGERGLIDPAIKNYMFPWYKPAERTALLTKLGKREVGLQEIIDNYVIPTQGQYMWMFGRVANFSTKANSDGSFECSVKVVGPSEDSWAYSTKHTIIPPKDNSGKICADSVHSVESYFKNSVEGLNFKTLLDKIRNDESNPWSKHIIYIENGNKKGGDPEKGDSNANVSQYGFGDEDNAYFITWRFFVNMVLNDERDGVKAIFKKAGLRPEELKRISLLRPYTADNIAAATSINDPAENYVGSNKYLRSIDPSTLIVVNEPAAKAADEDRKNAGISIDQKYTEPSKTSEKFLSVGDFTNLPPDAADGALDKGLLSTGVWLNHKAVVISMLSSDTLIKGISTLLDRMNAATSNYWNLTLDEVDPINQGDTHNYTVTDTKLRESSLKAVEVAFGNLHVFNKYVRKKKNGELVGSELIDCSVDLSLPKRMFAQIATLGLVQPEDVAAAQSANQADEGLSNNSLILSDPNETLRRMFAITTLSTKTGQKNPDVTLSYAGESAQLGRVVCGNNVGSQLTAQTGGSGVSTANSPNTAGSPATKELVEEQIKAAEEKFKTRCSNCPPLTTSEPQTPQANVPFGSTPTTPPPTSKDLNLLAPKFRVKIEQLLADLKSQGVNAVVTSTLRTAQEQNYLFASGRTRAGAIITNARAGESWHNYGLAVDIGNAPPNKLGATARKLGLRWGGDFKTFYDPVHVQWKELPPAPKAIHKSALAENNLQQVWKMVGAD